LHVKSRPVTKSIPNWPRHHTVPIWPDEGVSSWTQPRLPDWESSSQNVPPGPISSMLSICQAPSSTELFGGLFGSSSEE